MKQPYNIELHIEELVLHGFSPNDRHDIGEAVQRELTRLFAEQGVHASLRRGSEAERVDGGTFNVKPGARAEGIGRRVGQAVYSGLQQEQRAMPRTIERR
jgi:hypothetical protein